MKHLRVHHISCGYFRTPCAWLSYGQGGLLERGPYVVHCLLIELPASHGGGLALVDSGLGREDMRRPLRRLGPGMAWGGGASAGRTALEHVQSIGAEPGDVRHILMTHLDKDHAGGLADFPAALVHVHAAELKAALQPRSLVDRQRYSPAHFAHGPRWQPFELSRARPWEPAGPLRLEFEVLGIEGLPEELQVIPLPGHTRGHCGVAWPGADGWLLHCGDSVYHAAWLMGQRPPLTIQLVERMLQTDGRALVSTRRRLQQLQAAGSVRVFCSHDPLAFRELGGVG